MAHQPQGSQPLKSGEERFLQSRESVTIEKSNVEALKQALRASMLKVGVRAANLPSDEEKAILIAHINLNYGKHTIEEITLAFDLAISGKLDVEVNCYENFSCLYFSNIMNAYRVWANQVAFYKEREKQPEQLQLNAPPMTDDELIQLAKDVWNNTKNFAFLPVKAYGALGRKGLLNLSDEEKAVIRSQAKAHVFSMYGDKEDRQSEIDSFCKKIAVSKILNRGDGNVYVIGC